MGGAIPVEELVMRSIDDLQMVLDVEFAKQMQWMHAAVACRRAEVYNFVPIRFMLRSVLGVVAAGYEKDSLLRKCRYMLRHATDYVYLHFLSGGDESVRKLREDYRQGFAN